MIENLDGNVGRLLAKFDALGLAENTIVMFSSDNGPNTDALQWRDARPQGQPLRGRAARAMLHSLAGETARRASACRRSPSMWMCCPPCWISSVRLCRTTQPLDGVSLAPLLRGRRHHGLSVCSSRSAGGAAGMAHPSPSIPAPRAATRTAGCMTTSRRCFSTCGTIPAKKTTSPRNSRKSPRHFRGLTTNGSAEAVATTAGQGAALSHHPRRRNRIARPLCHARKRSEVLRPGLGQRLGALPHRHGGGHVESGSAAGRPL